MILSDGDLIRAIRQGALTIEHYDSAAIQPSSIDLRLYHQFRVFNDAEHTHIDPRAIPDNLTALVTKSPDKPFILHPSEFILGSTIEVVTISAAYAARIEGKSSLGRLSLQIHSTAGVIDPGFNGDITLELSNVGKLPILLWPGMFIAQLTVFEMCSSARRPYGSPGLGSKYQGQRGPTAPRSQTITAAQ